MCGKAMEWTTRLLCRYTVAYEDIPLRFGRPEMVASLPEHRHRGLLWSCRNHDTIGPSRRTS